MADILQFGKKPENNKTEETGQEATSALEFFGNILAELKLSKFNIDQVVLLLKHTDSEQNESYSCARYGVGPVEALGAVRILDTMLIREFLNAVPR